MKTLQELLAEAKALREAIAALFAKHKTEDGKAFKDDVPAEAITEIETKQAELDAIDKQIEEKQAELAKLEEMEAKAAAIQKKHSAIVVRERPDMTPAQTGTEKKDLTLEESLLQALDGKQLIECVGRPLILEGFDAKTLFSTGAGWAPRQIRDDVVALAVHRQIQLLDAMPSLTWEDAVYRWMQETTLTNNAAERAESVEATASAFAESAFALTEQTATMRMVGHSVPVSMEQLEDVPQAASYLRDRLAWGALARFESQLVVGNGTAPNIRGLLNTTNIRTQAKGTDTYDDAFAKAIANVQQNGEANPTFVIMNPADYVKFRTGKDAVGQPILAGPREAYTQPLFGLLPIVTTAITAGTACIFDPMYVAAILRRGLVIELTNSHASDFVNGIYRFRASVRGNLAVYRAPAVCQITGL